MTNERIFQQLDGGLSLAERKRILHAYLIKQLAEQATHPELSKNIAYEVAGLLATDFALSLRDDDEYVQIFLMAGELELPEQHRSEGATWPKLKRLVDRLNASEDT